MRAASAALSLAVHVAVVVAVVTPVDARPPRRSPSKVVILPLPVARNPRPQSTLPPPEITPIVPVASPITFPAIVPSGVAPAAPTFEVLPLSGAMLAGLPTGDGAAGEGSLAEEHPAILAGPLPAYPELLRQAGLEGRVVLEAVVDTTGRVESGSLVVVATTHSGFVAPAQRALAASLFRPARIGGRAVRVRVRVPIDFKLGRDRL
ncbi:MAG TPA: energy transducer TonB [Gemmatimonadales bacterium]|jgi:protein TonB|nr:energy transducer TonB [Gemmatimonadales bacterium]